MKKLFLAITIMVASVSATNAQFYIGGGLSLWHYNGNTKTTSFSISPDAGYSFNNHWTVGLAVGFDARFYHDKTEERIYINSDGIPETSIYTYHNYYSFYAEPYARFNYFSTDRVKLFLDGVLGVALDEHGRYDGSQVIVRPGISVNITEHFSLVGTFGMLGYIHGVYLNNTGFGFRLQNSLRFGFYYSF